MKNIITRSISGIIYVALIVGALTAGPDWFLALTMVFTLLAMLEFQSLTATASDNSTMTAIIRIVDIAAALAICLMTRDDFAFLMMATISLAAYIVVRTVLAIYDNRQEAFAAVGRSIMSVAYIGLPLAIIALTDRCAGNGNPGRYLVLTMFVMIWLNDTGAFCVGSLIGRHRLCERLSPKKSWEGFYGGLIFCIAAGLGAFLLFGQANICTWIGMGVTVSIFSTWGDLFESLIKRTAGVKDSGRLMPGHGGMLDRIDSLLTVSPAFLIYTILTGML